MFFVDYDVVYGLAAWLAVSYVWRLATRPGLRLAGKHVLITGGSTGLGLAVATKCAQQGALVTIVSRSVKNLADGTAHIKAAAPAARVVALPCDVTRVDSVDAAFQEATVKQGRAPDIVICSAGIATPGYFAETDLAVHKAAMDLNYFGSLYCARAALPAMKAAGHGHIVFVSSAVCFLPMVGYTTYAPSKFALRGLGDCLRNELLRDNITVTMFYPSNMDTPAFAVENLTKPAETVQIEGSASTITPQAAADHLLAGMAAGNFSITNEFICEIGRMRNNGGPLNNTPLEVVLAPLLVFIGLAFTWWSDHVVRSAKPAKPSAAAAGHRPSL